MLIVFVVHRMIDLQVFFGWQHIYEGRHLYLCLAGWGSCGVKIPNWYRTTLKCMFYSPVYITTLPISIC